MPRPKSNPDEVYVRELRITPPDGKPITEWNLGTDDFVKVIAAQEGGYEDIRLHYHVYVECRRSASWLTKWIYSIAHCYNGETGNSVFFTRAPHENTIGYVVKHGLVVVRHGVTDTYITEWILKSQQYVRDKEKIRKREHRSSKSFTREVLKKVVDAVQTDASLRYEEAILNLILAEYHEASKPYPTRSTIETLIVTILHPYQPGLVNRFYLRSFSSF